MSAKGQNARWRRGGRAKNSSLIEVSSTAGCPRLLPMPGAVLLSYGSGIQIRASRDGPEGNIRSAASTFERKGLAAAQASGGGRQSCIRSDVARRLCDSTGRSFHLRRGCPSRRISRPRAPGGLGAANVAQSPASALAPRRGRRRPHRLSEVIARTPGTGSTPARRRTLGEEWTRHPRR
jgi:hypothetical protein